MSVSKFKDFHTVLKDEFSKEFKEELRTYHAIASGRDKAVVE